MFKLVISPTVLFEVKGKLRDDKGADVAFDFQLEATRDAAEVLEHAITQEGQQNSRDYMAARVTGWRKVADDAGQPLPFSPEGLAQLFTIPGMASLCFTAYLGAVGAQGRAIK